MTESRQGILILVGQIIATVAIAAVLLGFASRRHADVTQARLDAIAAAEQVAAIEAGDLFVKRVNRVEPGDPFAEVWTDAPAMAVPVLPQGLTMPMLDTASVDTVRLAAMADGEVIAWRVSWPDDSPDQNVDAARFCDAVALQFPLLRNASFMMGSRDTMVQILHWKGIWQKDIDEHFQDVQDVHPNYWTDLYWFAQGDAKPARVPDSFEDERSHAWFVAYTAGNPVADFKREQPVEELSAEGYGSLTSQAETVTFGRGVWQDGHWAVLFVRPLTTDDALDFQFSHGGTGEVGVAVWEGSSGNVGGRKHYSNWVRFKVQS